MVRRWRRSVSAVPGRLRWALGEKCGTGGLDLSQAVYLLIEDRDTGLPPRKVTDCIWGDSLRVYLASLAPQAKAPTLAGAGERHPEDPGSDNLQGRGSRN